MDDQALVEFFRRLDRRLFLDPVMVPFAHLDQPLLIGHGQTISQPTLVVEMTRLLSPESTSRVLEIGTGSGYQTAFLAAFSAQVYTVERIPELSSKAHKRLTAMGFENIHYLVGDGSMGWAEHAPYDRIIVTAAAGRLPQELTEQLAIGGRMIIPVGPPGCQELLLITRDDHGQLQQACLERVVFVELVGKYGFSS